MSEPNELIKLLENFPEKPWDLGSSELESECDDGIRQSTSGKVVELVFSECKSKCDDGIRRSASGKSRGIGMV